MHAQTPGHVKYPGPAPFCPVFQPPPPCLAVPLSLGDTVLNFPELAQGSHLYLNLICMPLEQATWFVPHFLYLSSCKNGPRRRAQIYRADSKGISPCVSPSPPSTCPHGRSLTPAGTVLPSSIPVSTTQNLCPQSVQCELPRLSAAFSISLSLHRLFSVPGTLTQYLTPRLP